MNTYICSHFIGQVLHTISKCVRKARSERKLLMQHEGCWLRICILQIFVDDKFFTVLDFVVGMAVYQIPFALHK
jgi:hypothetical protein